MLFVGIFGEHQKLVTKYFHQKALNSIATFTVHTQLINLFLLEKLSLENIQHFRKRRLKYFSSRIKLRFSAKKGMVTTSQKSSLFSARSIASNLTLEHAAADEVRGQMHFCLFFREKRTRYSQVK